MKSEMPFLGPSRRDFLRNTALGGLAALAATFVARRPRQTCVKDGLCRGCAAFDDCGLPRALSMKREGSKQRSG